MTQTLVGQDTAAAPASAHALWQGVLARLSGRLGAHTFQNWFRTMGVVELVGLDLTLGVPNAFHQDWVRNHYKDLLEEEFGKDLPGCKVRFLVVESMAPEVSTASSLPMPALPAASMLPQPASNAVVLPKERPASNISPRYTFDGFVAGPGNQFARSAALAVTDKPARAYNPLFLFGAVGLGKTHLLHAIGNRLQQVRPELNVLYVSGETFTNEVISSIQNGRMEQFRARYRTLCDVLLIDDIHFIAGKERTQEEFFHAFNHLHGMGKQVVVSSDRFPHEMEGMEERLRSRLQWGLIVDIQPPELETRVAILHAKAREHAVELPEDVAHFLANHLRHNVRELEGALLRCVAASSFKKRALDITLCKEELRDAVMRHARVPTCQDIQKHVGSYYNVQVAELKGAKRNRAVMLPRHMAMYLCRKHTGASFPEIGLAFGGKDHSTVMASVRKIEDMVKVDPAVAQAAEQLGKMLEA